MITVRRLRGGKRAIDITCNTCGLPITTVHRYGMDCKNRCMLKGFKALPLRERKIVQWLCPPLRRRQRGAR